MRTGPVEERNTPNRILPGKMGTNFEQRTVAALG